jgi:menaquinone-dependent protoporphyrinogen IX oxidase
MGIKILVAYTTNSGSTEDVAKELAAQLSQAGHQADVRRLSEVSGLESYQAVVIGAPMILGWHREAEQFLKKNQTILSHKKVALFATAMSLTDLGETFGEGLSLHLDPGLAAKAHNPRFLSIKERYTCVSNYIRPMIKSAPAVKPVSVAFFGGKLELFRLNWWQVLFVMLVVRAKPGDFRNWDFIKQWGATLSTQLG